MKQETILKIVFYLILFAVAIFIGSNNAFQGWIKKPIVEAQIRDLVWVLIIVNIIIDFSKGLSK